MICTKCNSEQIRFGKYRCKSCRDIYHLHWRTENKEKWLKSSRAWTKKNKSLSKTIKEKYEKTNRDKILKSRRLSYKQGNRKTDYKTDPFVRREIKNRYRARKLNAISEKYKAKDIFERDNWECVYCKNEAFCLDHVVPLSRNGTDTIDNLVAACKSCNTSKGSKLLTEWERFFC